MGDVVTKKFDLSLSGWVWTIARYPLAQFVPINKKTDVCAWTPKNPETDFGLFTRDKLRKDMIQLFSQQVNKITSSINIIPSFHNSFM